MIYIVVEGIISFEMDSQKINKAMSTILGLQDFNSTTLEFLYFR